MKQYHLDANEEYLRTSPIMEKLANMSYDITAAQRMSYFITFITIGIPIIVLSNDNDNIIDNEGAYARSKSQNVINLLKSNAQFMSTAFNRLSQLTDYDHIRWSLVKLLETIQTLNTLKVPNALKNAYGIMTEYIKNQVDDGLAVTFLTLGEWADSHKLDFTKYNYIFNSKKYSALMDNSYSMTDEITKQLTSVNRACKYHYFNWACVAMGFIYVRFIDKNITPYQSNKARYTSGLTDIMEFMNIPSNIEYTIMLESDDVDDNDEVVVTAIKKRAAPYLLRKLSELLDETRIMTDEIIEEKFDDIKDQNTDSMFLALITKCWDLVMPSTTLILVNELALKFGPKDARPIEMIGTESRSYGHSPSDGNDYTHNALFLTDTVKYFKFGLRPITTDQLNKIKKNIQPIGYFSHSINQGQYSMATEKYLPNPTLKNMLLALMSEKI